MSLRRPRNLAAILLPYACLGAVAVVVGDPVVALLALSPSVLVGPDLARFVGGRSETAGALVTGAIVVSFALLMATGRTQNASAPLFAFVIGAAIAGAIPTVRDAILPVLDGARYVAAVIILGVAVVTGLALVDPRAVGLALLVLAVGGVSAAIGAMAFGGDGRAAAIGAGTRDPAVAAALTIASGLVGGAAVAIAYAALLALGLGVARLLVARQS
jgi:hypothetical protein